MTGSEEGLRPHILHLNPSLRITRNFCLSELPRFVLCGLLPIGILTGCSIFCFCSLLAYSTNFSNAFLHPPNRCSYVPNEYRDNGFSISPHLGCLPSFIQISSKFSNNSSPVIPCKFLIFKP